MNYFDIHTHQISSCPSQSITSVHATSLSIDKRIVYASIGIHPWTLTEKNAQEQWNSLQQAVMDKRIIAIGEAGIDKIKGPSLKIQTNIFQQEVILSETMGLPLIIHCVRASNEIIQLKKKMMPLQPWIIHGFRNNISIAQNLLQHGFYLSFGYQFQEDALKSVPLEKIFIETDESEESIENIYRKIASIRDMKVEKLVEAIKKNVQKIFFKA